MHTARLETIQASVSVATTRYCFWGPNEQVWIGRQWSPPDLNSRGNKVLGLMSEGRKRGERGTLSFDLSHDPFDVTSHPLCERTDACESITFPQLSAKLPKTNTLQNQYMTNTRANGMVDICRWITWQITKQIRTNDLKLLMHCTMGFVILCSKYQSIH